MQFGNGQFDYTIQGPDIAGNFLQGQKIKAGIEQNKLMEQIQGLIKEGKMEEAQALAQSAGLADKFGFGASALGGIAPVGGGASALAGLNNLGTVL